MVNTPKVVAFVGMMGAGKGTCSDYLGDVYGLPVVHFGSMVYEEVQRRGLHNVDDETFVRNDMRAKEGKAVMAKHAAKKADEYAANGRVRVAFDGLYSWSEYKYLREKYGDNLIVVALAAPRAERWRRVVERKDAHRKYTVEQVKAREVNEIEELEKGGPIAIADYTIVNTKGVDDLQQQVDKLLREIGYLTTEDTRKAS